VKGAATTTGSAVATGATKTADVVTGKDDEKKQADQAQKDRAKELELHVAAAPTANVDLDAQVNHKVELVGMMSSKDLTSAKGKSAGDMAKMPLMFKATSVKSIADKCQ
jgi:ribosomal protein L9